MDFSYICTKIKAAEVSNFPFRHIQIDNLFEESDFKEIVSSSEIRTPEASGDEKLFETLFSSGYRIIQFPGCTVDYQDYIKWHKNRKISHMMGSSCEGFGVVLRLEAYKTDVIKKLAEFLESAAFIECIAERFDVDVNQCKYDAGIQKYLDGYEISPHPDIRSKALTFMVNINPNPTSSEIEHHTSYLSFKPEWRYVEEFWKGNPKVDRCWVPWDWCDIKAQQRNNNSIVIFSPDDDTLHAVKANYNHYRFQRTQLYGNLWYTINPVVLDKPAWEDYIVRGTPGLKAAARDYLNGATNRIRDRLNRKSTLRSTLTHSDRKY